MDIEKTHENGYHDAPVVEVTVFVNFLNHNHMAVGRGDNELGGVFHIKITNGASEKVQHHQIYGAKQRYKTPKRNLAVETTP